MPHLFTVRWPLFARMEAILFFPFALRYVSETEPVRIYIDNGLVPAVGPICARMGMPDNLIFWLSVTFVVVLPYVFALILADRFLTIRKGYALLSALAIAIWAGTALRLHWLAIDYVPESMRAGTDRLPFDQECALAVGALALLLHLRPLWVGLRDNGEIAGRLLDAAYSRAWRRAGGYNAAQDLYRRQTAGFRDWRGPQRQLDGLDPEPRESSAVKALYAVTWTGVILGVGTAYLNWNGIIDLRHDRAEPTPAVAVGPNKPVPSVKPGVPVPTSVPVPVVQSAPALPMVNSHVVAVAPLPVVQRPTEMSANAYSPGAIAGNEAVAEREPDGSFSFDAVVNGGTHVRMLFDTGASVVGLRPEDAARIGIPVAKLAYSAKIKTANGTAEVAPVTIASMTIGNITLRNVTGFVAKEGMLQENLLGQTFLERLAGFNVERNRLVLRGR